MKGSKKKKICFIIMPIGGSRSKTRKRSDLVLKEIINQAAKKCGFETIRSDMEPLPGEIPLQIVRHLRKDPMVVADLTDGNPNVFYELGRRHETGKPVVMLIKNGQKIPFDLTVHRVIFYDLNTKGIEKCRKELVKQIRYAKKKQTKP